MIGLALASAPSYRWVELDRGSILVSYSVHEARRGRVIFRTENVAGGSKIDWTYRGRRVSAGHHRGQSITLVPGGEVVFLRTRYDYGKMVDLESGRVLWEAKSKPNLAVARSLGDSLFVFGTLYDATGNPVLELPTGVTLHWAKRRLIGVKHDQQGYHLVELDGQGQTLRSAKISSLDFGIERLVGNPETGVFAVVERGNRYESSKLFRPNFESAEFLEGQEFSVEDIGPQGILGYFQKGSVAGSVRGDAFCMDAKTGKIKWRGEVAGRWIGRYMLHDRSLYDGNTGVKVVDLIPPAGARVFGPIDGPYFEAYDDRNPFLLELKTD